MQFKTLLLIASTALAVSAVDTAPESGNVQAKRNFVFPDDADEEYPSEPQAPTEATNSGTSSAKLLDNVPEKQRTLDKNGVLCYDYRNDDIKDIPDECLKTVFCDSFYPHNFMDCSHGKVENYTREQLLKMSEICVTRSICDPQDYYKSVFPYKE